MAVVEFESFVRRADARGPSPRELRMVPIAVALWLSEAAVLLLSNPETSWDPSVVWLMTVGLTLLGLAIAWRRPTARLLVALVGITAIVGASLAGLRAAPLRAPPLADLVGRGAYVNAEFTLTSSPKFSDVTTSFGGPATARRWTAAATLYQLSAGDGNWLLRVPVTVSATADQPGGQADAKMAGSSGQSTVIPVPGARMKGPAVLRSPWPGQPSAAMVSLRGPPVEVRPASGWHRVTQLVRTSMAQAAAGLPPDSRGLLPGLVVGDETQMPPDLIADMRRVGMSHLTAVSGSNLAIATGGVLLICRSIRIPRRASALLAALALVCFVAVVGPEASVLRAAVMGAIALVALTTGRSRAPGSVLAVSVVILLLIDPWLSLSLGFALSVAATLGLVVYAQLARDRDDLGRFRRLLRDAVGITVAAQLATAPLVAAIGGGLPLIGVPANLLAAPAVPPATIVGVMTALVAPVRPELAAQLAWVAGIATEWIAKVARACATVTWAILPWPQGFVGALLVALAIAVCWWLARRYRSPRTLVLLVATALAVAIALHSSVASGSWPPPRWSAVFCDVGQGDSTVIATQSRHAIVIDAGPDPESVDRCLTDLGIVAIDLLVLTHFHADHVEGLPGLLPGRSIGRVLVSPLAEPAGEVQRVTSWLAERQLRPETAAAGEQSVVGTVRYQVLWPQRILRGQGSDPNNASVTLLVEAGNLRILVPGDLEPAAQEQLINSGTPAALDVVKIPHHGSRNQSPRLINWTGARMAIASAGVGNSYGHPSPVTINAWQDAGALVGRTDTGGDIAVLTTTDGLAGMVTRRTQ